MIGDASTQHYKSNFMKHNANCSERKNNWRNKLAADSISCTVVSPWMLKYCHRMTAKQPTSFDLGFRHWRQNSQSEEKMSHQRKQRWNSLVRVAKILHCWLQHITKYLF
mmetsp:Transcript_42264/g.106492  ORF Transcript_42264/g.106492 Transcript_42264/m.106492 type:complete len:109 (+) Transcript_42264:418-744(+)